MRDILNRVFDRTRPTQEPVAYVVAGIAVLFTLYQTLVEGKPLTEVVGENYVEGVVLFVTGVITRLSVYAPKTVADREKVALDTFEHIEVPEPTELPDPRVDEVDPDTL